MIAADREHHGIRGDLAVRGFQREAAAWVLRQPGHGDTLPDWRGNMSGVGLDVGDDLCRAA